MSSYSGLKSLGKSSSPMAMAIYTSILTVPIIGCSDDSDSSDGDPSTAITLSNETISSPGTHFVLVTNTSGYDIRILSFAVNSLPEGVMLDSEKNRCDSIILKAGESCTFSYSVSEDAYGKTEKPITIQYAAADFGPVYSTDDQSTIPTLAVDGVSLVFENGDFVVKRASMSGPESTDVEIKNLGPFTWQLEVDASIFSIEKSSGSSAEPSGLTVQASAANSCIGNDGTVPVGSSCFVSVRSTDESVDDTAQYILKVNADSSRNVASGISVNFPLLNDGMVTAGVSADDGTVYPSIKAIKIANTINFSASIMARLDSDSFEVYYQSPEQLWCNEGLCRDSCYTQEHPFVYPESRSVELPAISEQTAGSCYVYLRPKGLAVAEHSDANLFISNSRSDATHEFVVSGKGVLYSSGYFTDGMDELEENYIAQYDGSWSKSTPEAGVEEAIKQLAVDGQGRLYIKRGLGSNNYLGRKDEDGWGHYELGGSSEPASSPSEAMIAGESGVLYIAGYFDADAVPEKTIGKFDGNSWDPAFAEESRVEFLGTSIESFALDNSDSLYVVGSTLGSEIDPSEQFVRRYDNNANQWSDFSNIGDLAGDISSFVIGEQGGLYTSGYVDGAGTDIFVSQYNPSTESWDSLDYPIDGGYGIDPGSLMADSDGNLYLKGAHLLVYSASEKSWSSIDLSEAGLLGSIPLMVPDDSGSIYVATPIASDSPNPEHRVRRYSGSAMQWNDDETAPSDEVFNHIISDFAISNLIEIDAQ